MHYLKPKILLAAALAVSLPNFGPAPSPAQTAPAFPDTVTREAAVDAGRLANGGYRLQRGPSGRLHARAATRTRAVTVCSDIWFTMIGITWEQTSRDEVHALLRTRGDGGEFGDRARLASNPSDTPDPGIELHPTLQGTPAVWTGGARCARVALELPAGATIGDVQVMFINSSGSAEGPGTAPQEPQPAALAPEPLMTDKPNIIMRDEWGAPKNPRCGPNYADEVKMMFVHHTDGKNSYSKSQSDDILRGILAYHVQGRGWCDVAYNFLIDKYGRTYEGRAGGIEEPVISAATQGVNEGSSSVALMGSYSRRRPTSDGIKALEDLLAWRLDVAHVPPDERTKMTSSGGPNTFLNKGETIRLRTISGHRDTGYTDCPGSKLYRRLREIRREVAKTGLPKIYWPTAKKVSSTEWRFRARASDSLDWTVEIARAGTGEILRTFTPPNGKEMSVNWDLTDENGDPVGTGNYTATISGTNGAGDARPAELIVRLD